MVCKKTRIVNDEGFHMRAASDFIKAMAPFQSEITISSEKKSVNGKSVMALMTACFKKGTEIQVQCEGADEAAMLEAACALIDSGFGEK